jgi:hypothetical protein
MTLIWMGDAGCVKFLDILYDVNMMLPRIFLHKKRKPRTSGIHVGLMTEHETWLIRRVTLDLGKVCHQSVNTIISACASECVDFIYSGTRL